MVAPGCKMPHSDGFAEMPRDPVMCRCRRGRDRNFRSETPRQCKDQYEIRDDQYEAMRRAKDAPMPSLRSRPTLNEL